MPRNSPGAALVLLPAVGAASGYLQAWLKFCAGFGSAGIFNVGSLGERQQLVQLGRSCRSAPELEPPRA